MFLSNENSSMMDGFSDTVLKYNSLESSFQNVVYLKGKDEIELIFIFVKNRVSVETT